MQGLNGALSVVTPAPKNQGRVFKFSKGVENALYHLVVEFISPPKVYTFSFIVDTIIPQSVKVSTQLLRSSALRKIKLGLGRL